MERFIFFVLRDGLPGGWPAKDAYVTGAAHATNDCSASGGAHPMTCRRVNAAARTSSEYRVALPQSPDHADRGSGHQDDRDGQVLRAQTLGVRHAVNQVDSCVQAGQGRGQPRRRAEGPVSTVAATLKSTIAAAAAGAILRRKRALPGRLMVAVALRLAQDQSARR